MRVYIAGPMSGQIPHNNRESFAQAWNKLINAGIDAISPHFLESAIEVQTRAKMGTAAVYRHVLPTDIFAISSVDACVALPGWKESKGAALEKHFAELIEIPWIYSDLFQSWDITPDQLDEYLEACILQLKDYALAYTGSPRLT